MHFSDLHILASTMPLIIEFFIKIKRTDKINNFKFTIKFLMTLDRSYIGYLGFLCIDLFKSVLMYSNGTICLIKLVFKMGLFTVCGAQIPPGYRHNITKQLCRSLLQLRIEKTFQQVLF